MKIDKQPLDCAHHLLCPSCGKPVYVAHPDKGEVPGGGTWLRDGDTIGGLYQMLSEAQKSPSAFDYELMVGGCRACGADYYVALASFMNASYNDVEHYLLFNTKLGSERNFICSLLDAVDGVPSQWLMHEYSTPKGLMHHHVFGPWALESPEGVIGNYGVSACGGAVADPLVHARGLLFTIWSG